MISSNYYHMTLGIPLNITNLNYDDYNYFLLNVKYQQELRIKIIIPNEVEKNKLEQKYIYIMEFIDNEYVKTTEEISFSDVSIRYYYNNTIRILFPYYIRKPRTNILNLLHWPYYKPKYFYIIIELAQHYNLNLGITYNFNNILEYYENNFFILGVERFKRMNVSLIVKSSEFETFGDIYIKEFSKWSEDFFDYDECSFPYYNLKIINEIDNIYSIDFVYDIKLYPIVVLSLRFKCDIYYLNMSVNAFGNEIIFEENNKTKIISDIKVGIPYYFFTKTSQFQTSLITLYTKYLNESPFDYVDIFEYKNKSNKEYRMIQKQCSKKEKINENELIN